MTRHPPYNAFHEDKVMDIPRSPGAGRGVLLL